MQKNNYDRLAPFYDFISRAVYGQALVRAQRSVLHFLEDGQDVLVVGGGTGWILDEIEKLERKNIAVTYIEASSKMIALARKRKVSFPVDFICEYIENVAFSSPQLHGESSPHNIPSPQSGQAGTLRRSGYFDIVITPFFFDNFSEEKCLFLFEKMDKMLRQNGLLLYVDFRLTPQNCKKWKRFLLWTMYLFFRVLTHIETKQLVDMASIFPKKYREEWSQYSFHDFVFAAAYRKTFDTFAERDRGSGQKIF
ncbi:MAG: methyltransferase [Chitinophagaceae bacterium]